MICILLSAFVANKDKTETGRFLMSMLINDMMKVAWIGDEWYHGPICSADNCQLKTTNGINVAIFRQKIDSIENAVTAKTWLNSKISTINSVISYHADVPSLNVIISYINGKVGSLFQKHGYHSLLMVRNEKWFSSDCVINYGIYYQPVFTELPYAIIEYYQNSIISDAMRINLFLFI
ncbi:hypothetical protein Mgra_00007623 [Meloidogyne graminicola]|uniref:Uncharacterized protein n=1 Tax=Meloidogyne graminicola TaxID=189291 RepID=A0A8S9ZI74_9BILA|nr:hypothetical protein Mgra_00007623 [Meloidogyne graminicola]